MESNLQDSAQLTAASVQIHQGDPPAGSTSLDRRRTVSINFRLLYWTAGEGAGLAKPSSHFEGAAAVAASFAFDEPCAKFMFFFAMALPTRLIIEELKFCTRFISCSVQPTRVDPSVPPAKRDFIGDTLRFHIGFQ